MPKGTTLKHGNFTLDFRVNSKGEVEMVMHCSESQHTNGGWVNASNFKDLQAAATHGRNHLDKYYVKQSDGTYRESPKVKVGSIIKIINRDNHVAACGYLTKGKLYVVTEIDEDDMEIISLDDNDIEEGVYSPDFEVIQY